MVGAGYFPGLALIPFRSEVSHREQPGTLTLRPRLFAQNIRRLIIRSTRIHLLQGNPRPIILDLITVIAVIVIFAVFADYIAPLQPQLSKIGRYYRGILLFYVSLIRVLSNDHYIHSCCSYPHITIVLSTGSLIPTCRHQSSPDNHMPSSVIGSPLPPRPTYMYSS